MLSLEIIGLEDTPIWMIYRTGFSRQPEPVLVAWYNVCEFETGLFLTDRSFATQQEAQTWLDEFWYAHWVLGEKSGI